MHQCICVQIMSQRNEALRVWIAVVNERTAKVQNRKKPLRGSCWRCIYDRAWFRKPYDIWLYLHLLSSSFALSVRCTKERRNHIRYSRRWNTLSLRTCVSVSESSTVVCKRGCALWQCLETSCSTSSVISVFNSNFKYQLVCLPVYRCRSTSRTATGALSSRDLHL